MRLRELVRRAFGSAGDAKLGPAGWVAIVALVAVLIAAVCYAIDAWGRLSGVGISTAGWVFLALGVIFTIGLGIGLMGLVFYSSREGKDF